MTKCQRELLLDQAESYRNEMEKKHKEMSKFDFNSTGERSDLSDSSGSNQSSPDCKPFIFLMQDAMICIICPYVEPYCGRKNRNKKTEK